MCIIFENTSKQLLSIILLNEGVCPNLRVFYRIPTKSGINLVEWSVLNANVLDFRNVFALSNYVSN